MKTDFEELFEERAAILEFEAGFTKEEAERLATQEIQKMMSLKTAKTYIQTITQNQYLNLPPKKRELIREVRFLSPKQGEDWCQVQIKTTRTLEGYELPELP